MSTAERVQSRPIKPVQCPRCSATRSTTGECANCLRLGHWRDLHREEMSRGGCGSLPDGTGASWDNAVVVVEA